MPEPSDRLSAALEGRYAIERHDRPVAINVLKLALAAVIGAERFLAEIKTAPPGTRVAAPLGNPTHGSGEVLERSTNS